MSDAGAASDVGLTGNDAHGDDAGVNPDTGEGNTHFGSSGILASNRSMDWTSVGIPGGPPDSNWPICATIAPYGSSGSPAPSSQISDALASCNRAHPMGGVVVLGSGSFYLNTPIVFPNVPGTGHVALRGSGAASTSILYSGPGGSGGGLIVGTGDGTYRGGPNKVVDWTGGYAQGTTQITLSSVKGIVANQTILILNQCDTGFTGSSCTGTATDNLGYFVCDSPWTSANRGCNVGNESADGISWRTGGGPAWQAEWVQVTAINQGGCGATCVTLNHPLHHPNWSGSQSPQAVVMQPVLQYGVENMDIENVVGGTAGVSVNWANCYECWISGVRIANMHTWGLQLYNTVNSLVQNSYVFGNPNDYHDNTGYHANGGGYVLLQNNIAQHTSSMWFPDGPCDGCVVAHNLHVDCNQTNSNMSASSLAHSGAGNDYTLLEGNVYYRSIDEDDHGGHLDMVRFRNFITGWESCANGQCGSATAKDSATDAIDHNYASRYAADIANVLGTPGHHHKYLDHSRFGVGVIFEFGGAYESQPYDALSLPTSLLWGNWDVVTNDTRWCGDSKNTRWTTTCSSTSEVPTSAPTFPNPIPTLGDTAAGQGNLPASFYLTSRPAWWRSSIPYPAIGPDVAGGNVGQCSGPLNTPGKFNGVPATDASQCAGSGLSPAWAGHVYANPAMNCYLNVMKGPPDGTGPVLTFDPSACY